MTQGSYTERFHKLVRAIEDFESDFKDSLTDHGLEQKKVPAETPRRKYVEKYAGQLSAKAKRRISLLQIRKELDIAYRKQVAELKKVHDIQLTIIDKILEI